MPVFHKTIRDLTEKEWEPIANVGGYIGYIRTYETACLDGDFSVADLRQIADWLENQIKNGDKE